MSQAEALLNQAARVGMYTASPATEPHIVIGPDRVIAVPDELKRLGVQFDHNIETVTFDCPRYWDDTDISEMNLYINFERRDRAKTIIQAENVVVDPYDQSMIHFEWTIGRFVTMLEGDLKFNVCAKTVDNDGNEVEHWNSELCKECYISKGLETNSASGDPQPDIITYLQSRMDEILATDMTVKVSMEKVDNELVVGITAPDRTEEFRLVDGVTPHIGENGHWWIGDKDTGAIASPYPEDFMDAAVYDPQGKQTDIFQYVAENGVPKADSAKWHSRMSPGVYDPQGKRTDMFQYVHDNAVSPEDRAKWDGKSDFDGYYDDLRNKPVIPVQPIVSNSFTDDSPNHAASAAAVKEAYTVAKNAMVGVISEGTGSFEIYTGGTSNDKIWNIGSSMGHFGMRDPFLYWYILGDLLFICFEVDFDGRYPDNAYCRLTGITPIKAFGTANKACFMAGLNGEIHGGSNDYILYTGHMSAEVQCVTDGELLVRFRSGLMTSGQSTSRWLVRGCIVGLCKDILA